MLHCGKRETAAKETQAVPHAPSLRWQPASGEAQKLPPLAVALWRGLCCKCPNCGEAKLFGGFLKVVESCPSCEAPLGLARADDAPPYFTILVVGHIVVPLMLWLERAYAPPLLWQAALWLPVTLVMSLALLRPIKGATVGVMTACNMLKPSERA